EGVLHVLPQRQREDPGRAARREVPLRARDLRRVLAVGQVVEVVARRIPRRLRLIEHLARDAVEVLLLRAPDPDRAEAVLVAERERDPGTVRGPHVVAGAPGLVLRDVDDLLR